MKKSLSVLVLVASLFGFSTQAFALSAWPVYNSGGCSIKLSDGRSVSFPDADVLACYQLAREAIAETSLEAQGATAIDVQ
jgi:hypothetical protein